MGQTFIVANHTHSQYFRPMTLGQLGKLQHVVRGEITTLAVSLLVLRSKAESLKPTMAGSWSGAELELLGNEDARYDDIANRYTDVSYEVMATLSVSSDEARAYFVEMFGHGGLDAVHVGNAIFFEKCQTLREAIESRFGPAWTKAYKQASEHWKDLGVPAAS
jgi:hypothetical protein